MKSLIFIVFVPLLGWLGAASPIDPTKILVNRPNGDVFLPRERRSTLQQSEAEVGGYPISASTLAKRLNPGEYLCGDDMVHICRMVPGVKGASYEYVLPVSELERRVTKGEFVCGDRICMLEAGKVPPNCHGICQYPLGYITGP